GDAAIDALSQPPRRRWFGRRRKPKKALTHCENCEAPLNGPYCAQCGQHAIDYKRSLMQVMIDAADSFFDWDTKFVRSLGILLTRPGRLTNDFNAGRRVRYMHPLRLYFLASIAFFLLAKLINLAPSASPPMTAADRAEIDAALSKLVAPDSILNPEQRAKIQEARARFTQPEDAAIGSEDRSKLDRLITRLPRFADKQELNSKDLTKLDALLNQIPSPTPAPATTGTAETEAEKEPTPPAIASPSAKPKGGFHIQYDDPDGTKDPFGAWLEKRVKEKVGADGTKAELFFDTLRSNIPTMMLFCIPIFAFILKVLYFFQRRFYIEHLVYALHIHAFAYMAAVVITLIGMGALRVIPAFQPVLVVTLSLAAAVLVFLSIRRVYGQGWMFTAFKFFLGGVFYLIVLAVGVGATAFVTLLLP
ncbi:MAG: DUF3667 domain-containing protein, partial [Chthoniobacterales bacterium]